MPVPAERIDGAALTRAVETCFDLSMDGRLAPDQRAALQAAGKRLRGHLLELLAARFNAGTAELARANQALRGLDADLVAATRGLHAAEQALAAAGRTIAALDRLLGVAGTAATFL